MKNNNQRNSNNRNQEIGLQQRWDPFEDMREMRTRMLSNFGNGFFDDRGFFDDFGFGNSRNSNERRIDRIDRTFDDFGGNGGNYVKHSYVSRTVIGPDGRPVIEKKVKNETGTLKDDGTRVVEKNEAYRNDMDNVKRVVKSRTLGDKTYKVIRERANNERNVVEELDNLQEEEVSDFNKRWKEEARTGNQRFQIRYIDEPKKNEQRRLYYK